MQFVEQKYRARFSRSFAIIKYRRAASVYLFHDYFISFSADVELANGYLLATFHISVFDIF